ncbi:hypothetical protein POM88_011308 [Heracleum sosnowskyi]|uniref:ACT domain-containing protein ACR n=1 Tax=Heracleum sosnowskyi TaxID=360622 RepID=A0AAD8N1G7_9APIA|nr:hypothetical protein POM88_011308 [Heracleum sosnowskyi]
MVDIQSLGSGSSPKGLRRKRFSCRVLMGMILRLKLQWLHRCTYNTTSTDNNEPFDCLSGITNETLVKVIDYCKHHKFMLRVDCLDHVYSILYTQAYGRPFVPPTVKGYRTLDLFIQKSDGGKIVDHEFQDTLCSRLKEEMLHPLRVTITNRGPDTELLVANPVELSGKRRPRVFYDVTFALKMLGICVFSAEIGRHLTTDRQWEVFRKWSTGKLFVTGCA